MSDVDEGQYKSPLWYARKRWEEKKRFAASTPKCAFPDCERRMYQSNTRGLCRECEKLWKFNIWQAWTIHQEQKAATTTPAVTDDLSLPGRDF